AQCKAKVCPVAGSRHARRQSRSPHRIRKVALEETLAGVQMKRFISGWTGRWAGRQAGGLARRGGHVGVVVLLLSVGTFLMLELLPGNLADSLIGENSTPEEVARIEADIGLNRPVVERIGLWAWNALHGDLGRSPLTGEHVAH